MNYSQACFIRVEVKKRELISRIDLAIEMVKRGVPVFLGESYNSEELLSLGIDRGYFFGKCAQPDTLNKFKHLIENGWTFGALDEEGLLPDSLETFASQRFSLKSAETYKDIFFFGDEQKKTFEKIYGIRDSFIVSGNPRTDMWQTNCYGLYEQETKEIKKKYGDFVLIPINFDPYTTNSIQSSSKNNLQLASDGLAARSKFLFDSFCKLAERLAHEFRIKVIMRPHPSDDLQTIKALMIKHGVKSKLVHCISSNEVFPWISAAKTVFHNCCTTSIEAGFYGTTVVTYAPSNTSLLEESEINNLFPIAKTFEESLAFLNQTTKVPIGFRDRVAKWNRLNLENSGKIASFIADRIIHRNKFEVFQKKRFNEKLIDFRRFRYEIISVLSSLIGRRQRQVYLDKFPRTNVEEVKNIVNYICNYRGYSDLPEIKAINSRLFSFFPRNV